MEKDKKKRKNTKKKNKQNAVKHVDDTSASGQNSAPPEPEVNHDTDVAQVDANSAPDGHDAQLNVPKEGTHAVSATDEFVSTDKIQKLQLENDLSLQKEITHAGLLEKLEELQKEKAAHIQQEASLLEKVSQLEKEKDTYVKKEADLERKFSELQTDKEIQVQKESLLEIKIGQLQTEKESWFQKEVLLEEKINHLMGEATTLSSEKVILVEKVKHTEKERDALVSQEKLTKEVIDSLNGDNLNLKSQVAELEDLRSSLLQENHLLNEKVSDLQSQILSIERTAASSSSSIEIKTHTTENGNLAPQSETANALAERLVSENVALVEKVKELSVESQNNNLEQETSFTGDNTGVEVAYDSIRMQPKDGVSVMFNTSPAYDVINEAHENETGSDLRVEALRDDANNNKENNEYLSASNPVVRDVFPDSSKIIESDEIVQIPLDENERGLVDVDPEPSNDVDDAEVALVEAPLIGAPFRLISFFARYVSGADLVEKKSVKSGV